MLLHSGAQMKMVNQEASLQYQQMFSFSIWNNFTPNLIQKQYSAVLSISIIVFYEEAKTMSDTVKMHQRRSLSLPNIQGDFPGGEPRHFLCRITSEFYGKRRDLITP